MKKIPFIENTSEIRLFLQNKGYEPLSFFQGKKFIFPIISTRANKFGEWKEKSYSTANNPLNKKYLCKEKSSFSEFVKWIETYGN